MIAGGQPRSGKRRARLALTLRWFGAFVVLLLALDEVRYGGEVAAPGAVAGLDTGETVVEVRVSARDIDRVAPGATATVRLTGPIFADLAGQIAWVMPDPIARGETGEVYYLVRITLIPEALLFLASQHGVSVSASIAAKPRYLLRDLLPPPRWDRPYRAV